MNIKEVKKYNLDEACLFAYELSSLKENKLPLLSDSYVEIRKTFEKLSNHDFDQLIVAYSKGKIIGLLGFVTELKRKQLTVIAGPYIVEKTNRVANGFIKYLKQYYPGFSVVFQFYEHNINQQKSLNLFMAHKFAEISSFSLAKKKALLKPKNLKLIDDNSLEEFEEMYNKNSKLIYSPTKLYFSDKYEIYLYKNKDADGYVLLKKNDNYFVIEDLYVSDLNYDKVLENILFRNGKYKILVDERNQLLKASLIKKGFLFEEKILYYRSDF